MIQLSYLINPGIQHKKIVNRFKYLAVEKFNLAYEKATLFTYSTIIFKHYYTQTILIVQQNYTNLV